MLLVVSTNDSILDVSELTLCTADDELSETSGETDFGDEDDPTVL